MAENNGAREGLFDMARTAAEEFHCDGRVGERRVIAGLHAQLDVLRGCYKKLVYSRELISDAYEWLFDNYYILEREGRIAIKALLQLKTLPGDGDGCPAMLFHARRFCELAAGQIDAQAIETYMDGAQQVREFESVELSCFGLMLRAALIEGAARACGDDVDEKERLRLFSDAVKTLNFLTTFDFSEIVERQSRIERLLEQDPAGCYPKMDERSRAVYRKRLAEIAHRRKISESEAGRLALELARKGKTERERHVGYYILERELDHEKPRLRGRLYLICLAAVPAVVSLTLGALLKSPWLPLVLYLPLWEILRPVVEYFFMKGVPATFLPRYELEGEIPPEAETLVVISTLLSSPAKVPDFAKKLEQFYFSNGRGAISFGLLSDLKESRLPELPEDKAVRTAAVKAIRALNRKYGAHFCLFIRSRRYSETQGNFSGWERKRGAILELIRFLKGQQTSITTFEGDSAAMHRVKYIVTLDADTGLLMNAAAEMVSAAMHPLNAPEVDEARGVVTSGYGILSPRIGVDLTAAGRTAFSRVMAGCGGTTAYDNAAGDCYQDIFGEGIFAGKGLLHVDAFHRVLDNALPENRVLSHDILEGCFLRAAFLSDVELTDGFPPRPGAWFERLHRWVRGDWQNIPFLFNNIPARGGRVKTPFSRLSRFKLFDNLRRSVTPVAAFACLVAAAFAPPPAAVVLVLAALLAVAGGGLWSALLTVLHGGPSMLSRKYHCKVLPQAVNSVAQGVLSYLFLPQHALIALDAIVRAVVRQISGKKMLEWTTAAETEARGGGSLANLRYFWPCAVAGFAFVLPPFSLAARVAGAFWCITPFIAWLSGRDTQLNGDGLDDDQKDLLRSYTAAMWRYYEDYADQKDNYMPPDNVQDAPVHVVAHRTSPTNIGLMMLSTLAARDLGLIDTETLFERVLHSMSTLERMEKWNGHLYNWYDTCTLAPLRPRYISTVDSGNLLCCLTALREGCRDYYAEAPEAATAVMRRAQDFIDACDLSCLFNKRRKLFHIGYDVEEEKLSEIYYDLLMSEARMTSFYAIARRDAPKRHWGSLGRTLARQNGYTGPVSWTGTMFEYLMPHLLLPVYEDSMAAEAVRFAIFCQKQRVRGKDIPWGISESGFYAFDAALNYQYKAHGVQKLALKRGMDHELVVAPYATFLALPFDPAPAMRNLERLAQLGMYGRCGFFEAVDFTMRRTGGSPAVIKSYMAHHVGMSIVAAANALLDGVMQRRFMRDDRMKAAQELLEEKIPYSAVVFRDVMLREVPDKPGRPPLTREEFERVTPVLPRVQMLSNGEYTLLATDTGASMSIFRGIDVTRRPDDLLRAPLGVFAVVSFNGSAFSVTAAPAYARERLVRRKVEFHSNGAVYRARLSNYEASMHTVVHAQMPCECRMMELENMSAKKAKARLLFYFEPTLSRAADEAAHPAFSRLFLNVTYHPDTKMLVFARRPRGSELPAYLACGFAENDVDFVFETDRGRILSRPEGISSLLSALDAPFEGRQGAVPDAAAALRVEAELPAHSKKCVTLLMTAANTPDEAAMRLVEARREGYGGILRNAAGKDSNEIESRLAALILPSLLFGAGDGRSVRKLAVQNKLGQQGLWSLGVSGDFPIILLEYLQPQDVEKLEPYVRTHKSLRLRGVAADLVIVYREGGDYKRSRYNSILEAVKLAGCEYLLSARGGVHIVNLELHPPEIYHLLLACAAHTASGGIPKREETTPFALAPLLPAAPAQSETPAQTALPVYGGAFRGETFIIPHAQESPPAPWCDLLVNPAFGTLVSDRALGFTWAVNAHENKLTPWTSDPVSDNRGELAVLRQSGKLLDLCEGARVTFAADSAVYESQPGGLSCRLTVRVPPHAPVKIVTLELQNTEEKPMNVEAAYYIEPVLGVSAKTARLVSVQRKEKLVALRNPWAPVSGVGFLAAPGSDFTLMTDRASFFSARWENTELSASPDPCAAIIVKRKLPPKRTEKISFVLGFAADETAAEKLLELPLTQQPAKPELPVSDNAAEIRTPDEKLNVFFSHWLRWQFVASRLMGRTGFYQCGGAWGFRDQLQDSCAALLLDPSLARAHICRAAAHQFKEGDVMHWWHQLPPRDGGARGVRTRCSDDLLWLPYTVCEYLEKTGDESILGCEIHYLDGPELEFTEEDRYFSPCRSAEKENLYGHCVRAIERAKRFGEHKLPLFGSGDWNDGMNLVGMGGRGESVWLAMFLALVLERFAPVCEQRGDTPRAQAYRDEAAQLRAAVDETCWDGEWYLRGFYDDGSPLGGKACAECKIDLLPQSFAVLGGMPDAARRNSALDAALRRLCDERLGIVRLFEPPFDHGDHNPGYIKAYPPGIRENGGQYTHGAVWLAIALLREGRADDGWKVLSMLAPTGKSDDRQSAERYRLEPYFIAADISANSACEGRGGWSLYTGAAGWYYRAVFEYLLGIKLRGDAVYVEPVLPSSWPGYETRLSLRGGEISLKVSRGGQKGLLVDGSPAESIPLDGKPHQAECKI